MSIEGQVAIVTGGAVGFGWAFARDLTRAGADVTICDIRTDVGEVAAALGTPDRPIEGIVADVRESADVRRVVDRVVERTGRVDILINNAGVARFTSLDDPWDKVVDDYAHTVDTNLKGVYLFGRAVAPHMIRQRGGHIVNIATDHMHTCGWPEQVDHADAERCHEYLKLAPGIPRAPGSEEMDVYDASKWALNGLTRSWAMSMREHGVRVNNFCMGGANTPMQSAMWGGEIPDSLLPWLMKADDVSTVLMALLEEGPQGRSGDNVGMWVGHPAVLPPPSPILNITPASQ